MSYRLEFEIPGLPKSTNKLLGGSKWVKHRNAVFWKRQVGLMVSGKRPPEPLVHVMLILTRFNYRALDFDGLVASFKPIVDGLVEAGVMKNDTWKITGGWDVRQEYTPKGQERVRVVVYDASPTSSFMSTLNQDSVAKANGERESENGL